MPDAVLLDVMMPDMDGPTTFRHLQADEATRGIPVVLLTAKVQVGDRQVWDDLDVVGRDPQAVRPDDADHRGRRAPPLGDLSRSAREEV